MTWVLEVRPHRLSLLWAQPSDVSLKPEVPYLVDLLAGILQSEVSKSFGTIVLLVDTSYFLTLTSFPSDGYTIDSAEFSCDFVQGLLHLRTQSIQRENL